MLAQKLAKKFNAMRIFGIFSHTSRSHINKQCFLLRISHHHSYPSHVVEHIIFVSHIELESFTNRHGPLYVRIRLARLEKLNPIWQSSTCTGTMSTSSL